MRDIEFDLTPPQRLAVAYAPVAFRGAFALLLRLDARFADVVGKASEPMIGQMKLAWWREALFCDPAAQPKGEPLLREYRQYRGQIPDAALEKLHSAWEGLLVEGQWSQDAVQTFAGLRCDAIFGAYAAIASVTADVRCLGVEWAANDLRMQFGKRACDLAEAEKAAVSSARALRPLTILAMSVRGISGPRLIWHALTGR
jgi:15-cis-phytoene synthase